MNLFETLLLLTYVVEMMLLGFSLLYLLFRKEMVTPRILFIILGIIFFNSAVSSVLAYIFFWNGHLDIGILILIGAALVFAVPLKSKSASVNWRERLSLTIPTVIVLMVYEVSMGFFYGSAFLPHNTNPFLITINNLDFSVMMALDAIFFLFVSKQRGSKLEVALFTFALSMALMPNFFVSLGKNGILISSIISASIMVINIVILYVLQLKHKSYNIQVLAISLAASDLIMMVGLAYYAIYNDLIVLSTAMVISMVVYFFLVTHRLDTRPVKRKASYSFLLLLLVNGAELTMSLGITSLGFMLSNSLFPPSGTVYGSIFSNMHLGMISSINFSNPFWWIFPFDPGKMSIMAFHKGLSVNPFFAYFWSSFMLIMMTTMSPFYAIMMGSEMSYLVLERYRHTTNHRVRNWALSIIAGIPLFVVLIPFYSQFYIFGMSGMLFSVPLMILFISVASVIIASILFGRKAQCNLVCMSAHMWTNTFYDQFKPRRNRPNVWNVVRWISFFLMLISFSIFALQQIGLIGPVKVGMIMINPLDFYGMFVLNYVWWFFYFLTPVFGTYSCARQGWCGFGTLSGIFNKVFFKIRAEDTNLCSSCETRSCEKSCPTAIPLNSDFQKKGYSNRIACVGCGDCVESCEFSNLKILDFRDYIGVHSRSDQRFEKT